MISRWKNNLTYARGGFPGSLVVFTCVEAVISVLYCLLVVIALFSNSYLLNLGTFVVIGSLVVNTIMAVNLFRGLRAVYRGERGGADIAAGACKGRRIFIWLVFGLEVLLQIVALVQTSGYGFGAYLLVDMILVAVLLPVSFYYKDAEQILGHVSYEENGNVVLTTGIGHFSALCITFASILFILLCLYLFGVVDLRETLSSYSYGLQNYMGEIICGLLFLSIARFLVINKCYRGFLRAHAGIDKEDALKPTGHGVFPTVCVLGSIFFGLLFVLKISSILDYTRYYSFNSEAFIQLLSALAFLLLSVSLMSRAGKILRTVTAVAGSALMIYFYLNSLAVTFQNGPEVDLDLIVTLLVLIALVVFYGLVMICAISRRNGAPVSEGLYKAMCGIAVSLICVEALQFIVRFIDYYGFEFGTFLGVLIDLAATYAITLTGMLGLARMFRIAEEDESMDAPAPKAEPQVQ